MEKLIKFAYRITHIDNIPHILKYGIVREDSPNKNPNYVPIGDPSLIEARKNKYYNPRIPKGAIPFYFGPRSPMLYVIQFGRNGVKQVPPKNIVYIKISLKKIIQNNIECVFTNGHAVDALSDFFPKEDLIKINDIVAYEDVYAQFWFSTPDDPDRKRRKEAELLLIDDLPPQYIICYYVYNEEAKDNLISMGVDPDSIFIKPSFYY